MKPEPPSYNNKITKQKCTIGEGPGSLMIWLHDR